jgi:excisionase family DNA binding protein
MNTTKTVSQRERPADLEPLLGIRDVGELLNVSRATVYRFVDQGVLVPIRIGHGLRFAPADLRELLERQREPSEALEMREPDLSRAQDSRGDERAERTP